jgi:NTE family protein
VIRPVLGLALGGGAVRGLAHLGVLRVFERSGVSADVVCGTSSGAIIAGAIASGVSAEYLIEVALSMRWNELIKPSPRRDRLFDTSGLDVFITSVIAARSFDDLDRPYATVAEDRATGERVVMKQGDPVRAAAASSAIRWAFPPVEVDGRMLIDGIDVEPVPALTARELGATYVVGVDVLRVNTTRRVRTRAARRGAGVRVEENGADLMIRPSLGSRSPWKFSLASEMIALGEAAAETAVTRIKADLATLTLPAAAGSRSQQHSLHSAPPFTDSSG